MVAVQGEGGVALVPASGYSFQFPLSVHMCAILHYRDLCLTSALLSPVLSYYLDERKSIEQWWFVL